MKISEVFRKAATLIPNDPNHTGHTGCCFAISQAHQKLNKQWATYTSNTHKYFENIFFEKIETVYYFGTDYTPKIQKARRLALLLAAEITESEGL